MPYASSVKVDVESEEDEQPQQEEEVDNGRIVNNGIVNAPPVEEEATDNNIPVPARDVAVNGLNNFNTNLARLVVASREEWQDLKDDIKWDRLRQT